MPKAARLGDKAQCTGHSCKRQPPKHTVIGPAISGAAKTNINGKPALRVGDKGVHSSCAGKGTWVAFQVVGARNIFIEGKQPFAMGDLTKHCDENAPLGKMIEASGDVNYG